MSLAEIIEELPLLTLAERRELCCQALALEPGGRLEDNADILLPIEQVARVWR